jgi:alpha,alpha-trehalose phosphorylase (configuration-retaining)
MQAISHLKAAIMGEDTSRSKTTERGAIGPPMKVLYLGIAEAQDGEAKVALAFHDSVFIADSLVKTVELPAGNGRDENAGKVADLIISEVEKYEHENTAKVIGAGVPTNLRDNVPTLCSRLWLELDIVPVVVDAEQINDAKCFWGTNSVDEQADSTARTCAMHFGPTSVPFLQVGARGAISHGRVNLARLEDYRQTCSSEAWTELQRLVGTFKEKRKKMAFFSATPQGGGVAIMRHSLLRLANLLGLDFAWYGK